MLHLIFDLDGTLIDSVPDIHSSLNLMLDELEVGQVELSQTRDFVGNGSKKLVERAYDFFGKKDLSDEILDALTEKFVTIYMAHLVDQTVIYPNVHETLEKLKSDGHVLSLCTNKPLRPTLAILDSLKLSHFFSHVAGGDSYAERKPSALPLLELIKQQGSLPKDTIMIGDSVYDIAAGQNAKVKTVLVTYGYHGFAEDQQPPTIDIQHFEDLPRALLEITS